MNEKKQMPPYGVPPRAHSVFQGKIFDVYQWEQKMFDGSVQTFECLKRADTAVIIPVAGDKILIQRQLQPHWDRPLRCLPAGRCEQGEEARACAIRELREETGFASHDWIEFDRAYPYRAMIWERYVFIARNCKRVARQELDAGEQIDIEFVSFDEFLHVPDDPDWRDSSLSPFLYQCLLYPEKRRAFQEKLFGRAS